MEEYGAQLGFPSDEKLDEMNTKNGNHEFLVAENVEKYIPTEEEEDCFGKPKRTRYHFGNDCPLQLGDDYECKAYAWKHKRCSSMICADFARNYLAKHAFDSGNHPSTRGNRAASFEAAASVECFEEEEHYEERVAYRNQQAKQKDARERERSKPPRSPQRPRGGHATMPGHYGSSSGGGSSGGGGIVIGAPHMTHGTSHGPIHKVVHSVGARQAAAQAMAEQPDLEVAKRTSGTMKVSLSELETLHVCLKRCGESQKRLAGSLKYFCRQFEDEQVITEEAKNAVMQLIIRGRMAAGMPTLTI